MRLPTVIKTFCVKCKLNTRHGFDLCYKRTCFVWNEGRSRPIELVESNVGEIGLWLIAICMVMYAEHCYFFKGVYFYIKLVTRKYYWSVVVKRQKKED